MVDYSIFEYFDKSKVQWVRWLTRFEGAYAIIAPKSDQKKSLLLHYIGTDTYDLLWDKLAPTTPEAKTYEQLVEILKNVFDPTPLEIVENYRFTYGNKPTMKRWKNFRLLCENWQLAANSTPTWTPHCETNLCSDSQAFAFKTACWRLTN